MTDEDVVHFWRSGLSVVNHPRGGVANTIKRLLARATLALVALCAAGICTPRQTSGQLSNQFGGQDRANAAQNMIVLAVQQAISSLPPTPGQGFVYEYDSAQDTYVRSKRLGPTSLLSPRTVGAGKYSLRVALSYFELADSFAAIPYQVNDATGTPIYVAKFGLRAKAHVGLINVSLNHGFTNRFDVMINLPVVVVDAHASEIFSTRTSTLDVPPALARVAGVPIVDGNLNAALSDLDLALQPGGPLSLRKESLDSVGFEFNSGTHVGVGRISIGGKYLVYTDERLQLALAPEVSLPSPSEGSFAGSNTGALLPRVVGAFAVADPFKLHVNAGYDCDFSVDELRRFVWNLGGSVALSWATFDAGVGGSKYNRGITWTPPSAPFVDLQGLSGATIHALGNTQLGDNFIDALVGVKVRLGEKAVLSGAVTVPLNNEGFRAAAVGTLAAELYF